jgi:hypothetical protein
MMTHSTTIWSGAVVLLIAAASWAQNTAPSTRPANAAPPATQPAGEPMQARVVKLEGTVQYALTDAAGTTGEWKSAKVGDALPAGTRIRTRLRSKVVLTFGDDTVVMIDRATLASIDQFQRVADTKEVRLGLGHGAVRAGVAETTLRSDMTIETPTATLSKKGTMDFGIEYEPSTGRFKIDLAHEGLVQALNRITNESRDLHAGQYVTQAMVRWVETAAFDRHVSFTDVFGQTGAEKLFNALNGSGLGSAEPGGGLAARTVLLRQQGGTGGTGLNLGQGLTGVLTGAALLAPQSTTGGPKIVNRPEGNFGTGSGKLPQLWGTR